jgi:hypothetical protein
LSTQSTNEALQEVLYGNSQSSIEVSSPPLLTTWNFGLRRLLVPDVLQLNEEDKIIIVLSMSSCLLPLYKGVILQDIRQNNRSMNQTSRLELANDTLQ